MPAKNQSLINGKRSNILDKKLYKEFVKESGLDPGFKVFKEIIHDGCSIISNWPLKNPTGFKLPEDLGYLGIMRYKSTKKLIDFPNTLKYGKKIYYTNLHSFGYRYRYFWFKDGMVRWKKSVVYKIKPMQKVNRELSKVIKEGKTHYHIETKDHFKKNVSIKLKF